jgi:hypothetical protein
MFDVVVRGWGRGDGGEDGGEGSGDLGAGRAGSE